MTVQDPQTPSPAPLVRYVILPSGKLHAVPIEAAEATVAPPEPLAPAPDPIKELTKKEGDKAKDKAQAGAEASEAPLPRFKCSMCKRRTPRLHSDSYCSSCNNLKTIQRQRRFKEACVARCGHTCPCGEGRPHLLVFVHKFAQGGTPSESRISRMVGAVPLSKGVLTELALCDMLCRNCWLTKQFPGFPTNTLKAICARALGSQCRHCGYRQSLAALEFHHLDPGGKLVTIGGREKKGEGVASRRLRPKTIQAALLEAAKCELICSNCHADSHWKERNLKYGAYLEAVADLEESTEALEDSDLSTESVEEDWK